jgi:hypothetical protein
MRSDQSDLQSQCERCERELAECERLLRSGHPDVEGLCLAISDWSGDFGETRFHGPISVICIPKAPGTPEFEPDEPTSGGLLEMTESEDDGARQDAIPSWQLSSSRETEDE